MSKKPYEFQLYRVRYGEVGADTMCMTHIAVEGAGDSSMDEAAELAEEVRLLLSTDTGMDYKLQFLGCIGSVYVWKKI